MVSAALESTAAKGVLFSADCEAAVAEAVPELAGHRTASGAPFRSATHPNLTAVLTAGLDHMPGARNLTDVLSYSGAALPAVAEGDALARPLDASGKASGKALSQAEVVSSGAWPVVNSVLKREPVQI